MGACFEWESGECEMVEAEESDEDAVLTFSEAAERLGQTQQEVGRLVREYRIPAAMVNGRFGIRESDISRFLGGW